MGAFGYYLIIINAIGFILFAVNTWLYSNTAEGQVDRFLTITSLMGGSLGILISIFIFDRRVAGTSRTPLRKAMWPNCVKRSYGNSG